MRYDNRRLQGDTMAKGSVKFFSHEKHFGFIQVDGGGEIFFHMTGVSPAVDPATILKDVPVEFDIKKGKKGPQAFNVTLA
jgi:CspA family cold shock protein